MNTETIDDKIYSDQELEIFLEFLNLQENFGIDLSYMGESKIPNIDKYAIEHFNDALMRCKIERNISLLSLLTKLSTVYMSPSKIKSYINDEVKLEIIQETRNRYKAIRDEYPDLSPFF